MLSFCRNMRNANKNYKKMPLFTQYIRKYLFFLSSLTHCVDEDSGKHVGTSIHCGNIN